MDEAFLVGQALVALAIGAGARDFELDGEFRDLVAGELAQHRFGGAPFAAFLEPAHPRSQRTRCNAQSFTIPVTEIRLDILFQTFWGYHLEEYL